MLITRAKFAALWGCSKPMVTKLGDQGILALRGDLVDVRRTLERIAKQMPQVTPRAEFFLAHWDHIKKTGTAPAGAPEGGVIHQRDGRAPIVTGRPRRDGTRFVRGEEPDSAAVAPDVSAPAGAGKSAAAIAYETIQGVKAKMAQIELAKEQGRLVNREQSIAEVWECFRSARDAFLAIADRLAPILAAQTDAALVHKAIEDEVRAVLTDLSDRIERAAMLGKDAAV